MEKQAAAPYSIQKATDMIGITQIFSFNNINTEHNPSYSKCSIAQRTSDAHEKELVLAERAGQKSLKKMLHGHLGEKLCSITFP